MWVVVFFQFFMCQWNTGSFSYTYLWRNWSTSCAATAINFRALSWWFCRHNYHQTVPPPSHWSPIWQYFVAGSLFVMCSGSCGNANDKNNPSPGWWVSISFYFALNKLHNRSNCHPPGPWSIHTCSWMVLPSHPSFDINSCTHCCPAFEQCAEKVSDCMGNTARVTRYTKAFRNHKGKGFGCDSWDGLMVQRQQWFVRRDCCCAGQNWGWNCDQWTWGNWYLRIYWHIRYMTYYFSEDVWVQPNT